MVYEHLTDVTSHSQAAQKFQAGCLITFCSDLATGKAASLFKASIRQLIPHSGTCPRETGLSNCGSTKTGVPETEETRLESYTL
jgi:hypothetical protein